MTTFDLLEAISSVDDELLMRSEMNQKKNSWIKYVSLSACAVMVVALFAVIGFSTQSLKMPDSITDTNVTNLNNSNPRSDNGIADISDSGSGNSQLISSDDSSADSEISIIDPQETAPDPFEYSGGDENAWFYEPLLPKLGHITAEFGKYINLDEFEEWAYSVSVLHLKGDNVPTDLNDFLNAYALVEFFNITDEQIKAVYEAEINMENEPMLMRQEDLEILLTRDESKILAHFASEESIVIGNKIYSPQWIYENSVEAYKNEGISPLLLKQKYSLYMQYNLTQEAKEYLTKKINEYTNILPQATGGSDTSFSRRFVDEVYNIHIASEIVGNEECNRWVEDVYLKKSLEEREATPDLYQIITELSISKEDIISKNNEYKDMEVDYLPDYIIDALYEEDVEVMKQLLMNPLALYYNSSIYTFDELVKAETIIEIPENVIDEYISGLENYYIINGMEKYMEEELLPLKSKYQ